MIRLSKDKFLDDYFIDINGVITDKNGAIQKISIHYDNRPYFMNIQIHRIMMYTYYEYRDGHKWDIHHIDKNPLNNKLNNLIYLTHAEHTKIHNNGKIVSEETKRKISESHKCKKRKPHPEEIKRKISESVKAYWASKKINKLKQGVFNEMF